MKDGFLNRRLKRQLGAGSLAIAAVLMLGACSKEEQKAARDARYAARKAKK